MKLKFLFTTIFLAAIFIVVLVLLAAYGIPANAVPLTKPAHEVRDSFEVNVEIQVDAEALTPTATTAPKVTELPDGPTLLVSRCTQCHVARLLEKMEKPRAEWELSLAKMEALGVQLNEAEKVILLDYLSAIDKP
jgi:hypothetical protein